MSGTGQTGLEVVLHERRAKLMAVGMSMSGSYEPSMRSVLAGREGSWESQLLDAVHVDPAFALSRPHQRLLRHVLRKGQEVDVGNSFLKQVDVAAGLSR
jgi:hypothetical protein